MGTLSADEIPTLEIAKINGLQDALDSKVTKETDKSLVANTEITKLAGVSTGANKVEASTTNGNIKIDGVETIVYTHPAKHTVSEISDFDDAIKNYDYATKTEAQGYADAKDEAIAAAQKAGDDALAAIDVLNSDENTNGSVKKIAREEINRIIAAASEGDAMDDLTALVDYIEAHGGEAADMAAAIAVLEGKAHTHTNKELLDTYTQTEEDLADAVAKKHSHNFADEAALNGITAAKVAAWDAAEGNAAADAKSKADKALEDAKAYADALTEIDAEDMTAAVSVSSGSVDLRADDTMTVTLGVQNKCKINASSDGSIIVTGDIQVQAPAGDTSVANKKYVDDQDTAILEAAKKYADDNDADTTYTAKADGGLKLDGTEFSIDDTLTFVFDCGTSDPNYNALA